MICKYFYKGRPAYLVAKENGICKSTFLGRMKSGWSVERACTVKEAVKPDPIEELTCERCGKVFKRKKRRSLGKHVYCCKLCACLSKSSKVEKKCAYCGKKFEVSSYKKDTAKYCSIECRNLAYRRVFTVVTQEEILYYKKTYGKLWGWAAKRYSIPACYREEFFGHIDYYLFKTLFYRKLEKAENTTGFEIYLVKSSIKQAIAALLKENFNKLNCSIEDCEPFEWESPFDPDEKTYFAQKMKMLKEYDTEKNNGYKYLLKMYFNDWDIEDLAKNEGIDYNKIYNAIAKVKEYAKAHEI